MRATARARPRAIPATTPATARTDVLGPRDREPLADLLVVGLGNPGLDYEATRHNAGVWVIDELVRRHQGRLRRARRDPARTDELRIGSHKVVVAVPTTYMNESGRAVGPLARRYRVDLERIVIIHDELDLPVGRLKIKSGGGLAGNNGLKSVRNHLHDAGFTRVRLGVGKPPGEMKGADYVLRRPSRADREVLGQVVGRAADAVESLVARGLDATMNEFNQAS